MPSEVNRSVGTTLSGALRVDWNARNGALWAWVGTRATEKFSGKTAREAWSKGIYCTLLSLAGKSLREAPPRLERGLGPKRFPRVNDMTKSDHLPQICSVQEFDSMEGGSWVRGGCRRVARRNLCRLEQ
jgi:hypothetical protein